MAEVIEKSVKDLKAEATSLGIPASDVDSFNTKAQLVTVINSLKSKEVIKKVDTIVEKPNPTEEKKVNKTWLGKAGEMRDIIFAQPKVRFLCPPDPKEKPGKVELRTDKHGKPYQVVISGAVETVQINGFKYFVPKGVFVDVPQQVAEILSASYRLTSEAGKDMLIDREDPVTGTTVAEAL